MEDTVEFRMNMREVLLDEPVLPTEGIHHSRRHSMREQGTASIKPRKQNEDVGYSECKVLYTYLLITMNNQRRRRTVPPALFTMSFEKVTQHKNEQGANQ